MALLRTPGKDFLIFFIHFRKCSSGIGKGSEFRHPEALGTRRRGVLTLGPLVQVPVPGGFTD
jgi:hypothetical protein